MLARSAGSRSATIAVLVAIAVFAGSCSGSSRKKRPKPPGGCTPVITQVAPSIGDVAGGGTVTIITDCFTDDFTVCPPQVFFGVDAAISVTALNARTVTVVTPPHPVAEAVDVRVQGTCTAESATAALAFTYSASPPGPCSVISISPNQGFDTGGDTVTITGTNFDLPPAPTPTVQFGLGNLAPSVTVVSATTLQVVTPAGTGLVDVTITTQTGPCVLPASFFFSQTGGGTCTVTAVAPSQGFDNQQTPVIISGSGFDLPPNPAPTVEFGPGNLATGVVVLGLNQLACNAPPSATTGLVDVTVTNQSGAVCTLNGGFEYVTPPPVPMCTITSVSPADGPDFGGTDVSIFGTGFSASSRVWFGATEIVPIAWRSDTQIDVQAPPGTGPVDVRVDIGGGTTCTLTGGYRYISCGATSCTIQRAQPTRGNEGDQVAIRGSLFEVGARVFFGIAPDLAEAVVVDDSGAPTDLVVIAPPRVTASDTVDIHVINPSGVCCVDTGGFTYGGCFIESVTPNSGTPQGGNNVLIKGVALAPGIPEVWFGTEQSPDVQLFGGDVIAMTPPANGQTAVIVTVITTGGETCTFCCYNYFPECRVDTITPSSAGTNGQVNVTITGNGFDTGPQPPVGWTPLIKFGDIFALPNYINVDPTGTIITCQAPPSPVGGPVSVTIDNINTVTSCSGTFTYNLPGTSACSITSLSPDEGDINGGTVTTITGTGFDPGTGVVFGVYPADQVTYISDTQLSVVVPEAVGQSPTGPRHPVDVWVMPQNSDPCMLADGFTYTTPACSDGYCEVYSIVPDNGPLTGGNTVTINGASFCDARGPIVVYFESVPTTNVTLIDESTLEVVVPAGVAPGTINVLYTDGEGCANGCFSCYTYN